MNFGDPRLPERFWAKVAPCPMTGCWLWTGATIRGYGSRRSQRRHSYAHRDAYTAAHGPIPPGLDIDHKCRVTCCCNPLHLEAVTHAENMRRSPLGFQNIDTQRELARRSASQSPEKLSERARKIWQTRRENHGATGRKPA